MMNTNKFREFDLGVSARIDEIIEETQELSPSFLQAGIFDVKRSDSLIYRTEGVTGLGYIEKFDEDGSIKEDETDPQYQTEYIMTDRGKIVSISQKLAETRPSELENKLDEVRQLRIATNRSLNKNAWQVFVDGFSTSDSNSDINNCVCKWTEW